MQSNVHFGIIAVFDIGNKPKPFSIIFWVLTFNQFYGLRSAVIATLSRYKIHTDTACIVYATPGNRAPALTFFSAMIRPKMSA